MRCPAARPSGLPRLRRDYRQIGRRIATILSREGLEVWPKSCTPSPHGGRAESIIELTHPGPRTAVGPSSANREMCHANEPHFQRVARPDAASTDSAVDAQHV